MGNIKGVWFQLIFAFFILFCFLWGRIDILELENSHIFSFLEDFRDFFFTRLVVKLPKQKILFFFPFL